MLLWLIACTGPQESATDTPSDTAPEPCRACPDTDPPPPPPTPIVGYSCEVVRDGVIDTAAECWSDEPTRRVGRTVEAAPGGLVVASNQSEKMSDIGSVVRLGLAEDGHFTERVRMDVGGGGSFGMAVEAWGPRTFGFADTHLPRSGVYAFDGTSGALHAEDAAWWVNTREQGCWTSTLLAGTFGVGGAPRLLVTCPSQGIFALPTDGIGDADLATIADGTVSSSAMYLVSLAGSDLDGDGVADLLVGDCCDANVPAVALFQGPIVGQRSFADADGTWAREQDDDNAGVSVALDDLDGDGTADLIVGAHWHMDGTDRTGRAYVVHHPGSGSHDLADADAWVDGVADSEFGLGVAAVGDTDGDGIREWAASAPAAHAGGIGRVYLFDGPGVGAIDRDGAHVIRTSDTGDGFGGALAGIGDLDGDGFDDLAIGAPSNAGRGADAGTVFVVFGGPL